MVFQNVIDVDQYVDTFTAFVSDAISYDMQSEQPVKYSGVAFGTSDAISSIPRNPYFEFMITNLELVKLR